MPVPAMRAGDVVVGAQRLADSHGDGLLALVQVREAGHERAQIEIVGVLLELANGIHAPVDAQQLVFAQLGA